jgi:hypothetical protein
VPIASDKQIKQYYIEYILNYKKINQFYIKFANDEMHVLQI